MEALHNAVEEEKEPEKQSEVEPDPINIDNPVEPELTLKPWLNPDTETTDAKGTTDLIEEKITYVLLSMKQEDKGEEGNRDQQPGDQKKPLFAHVLYLRHWWLYVLDVKNKEFYIVDSVFGVNHDQLRQKLHRFGCNVLDQFRVWAGAKFLIKKGSNTLQLRPVDVPKQPNPTDCGVYVMKWMEALDTHALSFAYTFKKTCMIEEWDQDQLDGFREKIVAKVLLSEHNTLNFEAMNQSRTMTREAITEGRTKLGHRTKPSAALKSPFLNPSTAELEKKQ
ncbi:hypothetical protein PIB30_039907 [Stylosanthes scabra]|uniref:Ubiquitin-like protease family profile domain-containing protein n=1 Tax=Stylosanthes scabra TaxID=79078 RepID=A0ABU6ZD59_9FABA|nr:hypothetical protein [Stylosanthes scabra]